MLQELAGTTAAATWAIVSLLFFVLVFAGISVRVLSRSSAHYRRHARLPLEDAEGGE